MATVNTTLSINGSINNTPISIRKSESIENVIEIQENEQVVGNTDIPVCIWSNVAKAGASSTLEKGSTDNMKYALISNTGKASLEIFRKYEEWAAGISDINGGVKYLSSLLSPGSSMIISDQRELLYDSLESAGNASTVASTKTASMLTDGNGECVTTSLFGTNHQDLTVPGTIRLDFYKPAYQEMDYTGGNYPAQTATTQTGLSAATMYDLGVTLDGTGPYNLNVTTDTTDATWGVVGATQTGVLQKITTALELAFAKGSLASLPTVGIVDGNIRFTGSLALETPSTIAITDGTTNSMLGVGSVPATLAAAVNASVVTDDEDNSAFINTKGVGSRAYGGAMTFKDVDGHLNCDTLTMMGFPPNTSFELSYSHTSAHSGEADAQADTSNSLCALYARSLSPKGNGTVKITVLN